jgi:catechol 2,3-dioxygenase-like lactoylglutathione lyase family enzyme
MHIQRLRLFTAQLGELMDFYHGILELPIAWSNENGFGIQCGDGMLEFAAGGEENYYHVAFNIPSAAIEAAAAWLEELGIAILPLEGKRIVDFPNWAAKSVYFHDPAGNILELIARERLELPGGKPFGSDSIVGISEMGLPTDSMATVLQALESQIELARFWNPGPSFAAMGDDRGLFIVVDSKEKLWIPTMVPALPFPFEADISERGNTWKLNWSDGQLRLA